MIIQNGTIEFKAQAAGTINPETGYRSQPVSASWGDPQPCNIVPVKVNQLAQALGGEHFTKKTFQVFIEEDTPVTSERVRLKDLSGKVLGEFSTIEVVPLEATAMIRITV